MALYIKTKGSTSSVCFHIGEADLAKSLRAVAVFAESIQADESELFHIQHRFTVVYPDGSQQITIPFTTIRVQTWFGDIAKTILANW